LELIEKAIALDSANDLAWFYKANLLREMAKVGEKKGERAVGPGSIGWQTKPKFVLKN
jgi:hypothetical protein